MVRAEKNLLLLLSRRKSQFHVREKVTTTAGPVTAITFHDLPPSRPPSLRRQISALRHILDRFRFAKSQLEMLSDAGIRLSADPCMFGKSPLVSFRSAEGREEEDSGRQVRVG